MSSDLCMCAFTLQKETNKKKKLKRDRSQNRGSEWRTERRKKAICANRQTNDQGKEVERMSGNQEEMQDPTQHFLWPLQVERDLQDLLEGQSDNALPMISTSESRKAGKVRELKVKKTLEIST